jgi:hypothetical protein
VEDMLALLTEKPKIEIWNITFTEWCIKKLHTITWKKHVIVNCLNSYVQFL